MNHIIGQLSDFTKRLLKVEMTEQTLKCKIQKVVGECQATTTKPTDKDTRC
jgi:hypothetical protein